jgi:hypothetical protein
MVSAVSFRHRNPCKFYPWSKRFRPGFLVVLRLALNSEAPREWSPSCNVSH